MLVVCPFYTYRHYLLHTRVSLGDLPVPFLVERDGQQVLVRRHGRRRRAQPDDPRPRRPLRAGRAPDRRARRPQPHDLQRRLGLLPVPRAGARHASTSRWTRASPTAKARAWPTTSPPPTSSCSPTSGPAGTSRTPPTNTSATSPTRPSPTTSVSSERYEDNLVLLYERCEGGGGQSPADVTGKYPVTRSTSPDRG